MQSGHHLLPLQMFCRGVFSPEVHLDRLFAGVMVLLEVRSLQDSVEALLRLWCCCRGNERGTARPEVLQSLLKTTDRVVQEIDSVEYGLTDIQASHNFFAMSALSPAITLVQLNVHLQWCILAEHEGFFG